MVAVPSAIVPAKSNYLLNPIRALREVVGLGVVLLAPIAAIWTRITPGVALYPCSRRERSPPSPSRGGRIE